MAESAEAELPKAQLKRLIKAKLQAVDVARGGDGTRDYQVNKDALLAFSEAGKLFIHYLTATASDLAKDAKRQTISAEDVITALNDLELGAFEEPLRAALEGFRVEQKKKNVRKSAAKKQRSSTDGAGASTVAAIAEAAGTAAQGGEREDEAEEEEAGAEKRQRIEGPPEGQGGSAASPLPGDAVPDAGAAAEAACSGGEMRAR